MKAKIVSLVSTCSAIAVALVLFNLPVVCCGQESTIFTYQGRLGANGALANGAYDFRFSIYDSTNQPGVLIAGPLTNFTVIVSDGLFTTPLDFGVAPFDGSDRWLDIAVRTNGAASFTSLATRQQITLAPYAIMARASLFAVSNFTVGGALVLPPTNATIISPNGLVLHQDSYEENFFAGSGAGDWPGTTAQANTAVGINAMKNDSSGGDNSAFGDGALSGDTTGFANTAIGSAAMSSNTNGNFNTAIGVFAMVNNASGSDNTAEGVYALGGNTLGSDNTANGAFALLNNTNGFGNVADGYQALYNNLFGSQNTAVGFQALNSYTGIGYNTGLGNGALQLLTAGNDNIGIGDFGGHDLTTGSWNIDIGNPGTTGDDHLIRIGQQGTHTSTFIAGISGTTISGGAPVYVNSSGQLGTSSPAFVHTATVGNISSVFGEGQVTKIDNSLCNGKSGAILIITPADYGTGNTPDGHPYFVQYRGDNFWYIASNGGNISAGQQFNVFVANP